MTVTAALAESALAVSRVGDDPNPLNWWEQTIRQYENVNIVHWWIVAVFGAVALFFVVLVHPPIVPPTRLQRALQWSTTSPAP